jgi:hypothetical protein
MRLTVADIIVRTMKNMDLKYPTVGPDKQAGFKEVYNELKNEK